MTRQQGVKTERSIKDLNTLAPCKSCRSSSKSNSKNLHDTCKTADLSNSGSMFDLSKNSGSCSKCSSMNLSTESMDSSFSDLAKERGSSEFNVFEASFTGSNSSLDWAEDEAFPKSRSSSATPSTTCSTVDLSDFVVMSAFNLMEEAANDDDHQQEYYDMEEEGEELEEDMSEEESEEEEGEVSEEEFPLVDFDESVVVDVAVDDVSEEVLAPPPRDSVRMLNKRRSSVHQQMKQNRRDQAAEVALCQSLARSGIDPCKTPRRGRGRLSFKHQPSPLLNRANSDRSAMTENDADGLKRQQQCRASLRSLSRTRDASTSRPPSSRGQRAHLRDRSVSRDRSTATAPTTLEITLDRPLLGKALGDSESEDDDPLNMFGGRGKSKTAVSRTRSREPRPRRLARDQDECSRASSKGSKGSGTGGGKPKREQRRRRPSHHVSEGPTANRTRQPRRSVRPTKSADRVLKRAALNDCSARSNPEHPTTSLEDRLHNLSLIDASNRSNPERSSNHRPDPMLAERRPRNDTKPSKPRRKSGRVKPAAAAVPSLSSYLD